MVNKKLKKMAKNFVKGAVVNPMMSIVTDVVKDNISSALRSMSPVIIISDNSCSYQPLNRLLYELDPNKFMKYATPVTDSEWLEMVRGTRITFRLDSRNFIKVAVDTQKNRSAYDSVFTQVNFYGPERDKWRLKFVRKIIYGKIPDKIAIDSANGSRLYVQTRTFDSLIIDDDLKSRIVNGIMAWRRSKEWYLKNGMAYKIGILLYGKPGGGKSSIIRAISNMLGNCPIETLDTRNPTRMIDDAIESRRNIRGVMIMLIEDIDMLVSSREYLESGITNSNKVRSQSQYALIKAEAKDQSTQQALFQILDGMYSSDDTIYIATTNHIENLDPGLIRYGRFDIQEEIRYFDEERAKKFVEHMGFDVSVLNELGIEYPIQPSYLQSMIMEYRANEIMKRGR